MRKYARHFFKHSFLALLMGLIMITGAESAFAATEELTFRPSVLQTTNIQTSLGNITLSTTKTSGYVSTTQCYKILKNYRSAVNRKALTKSSKLEAYARIRAKELARKFSHTRPNGQNGTDIISWASCGYINGRAYKGENIACGQTSCKQVMASWYASSGHRKNMLSKNYTKVGIAGYTYKGVTYWVQLFTS